MVPCMPTLFVLALIALVLQVGQGMAIPVLSEPTEGASATFTAFLAAQLVALLVGGAGTDRFGAGRVLGAGIIAHALALAGLALMPSFVGTIVFGALAGVGLGLAVPALSAKVLGTGDAASFTQRHGVVLGLGGAGAVVGATARTIVGEVHAHEAMLVVAAMTVVTVGLVSRLDTTDAVRDPDAFTRDAFFRYVRRPAFVLLVLPLAFAKLAFGALRLLVPIHAAHIVLSAGMVATLVTLTGVLFALAQPLVGMLHTRVPNRTLTRVSVAISGISLASIAGTRSPIGFCAGYLAFVVFASMTFAANAGFVGERHHEGARDHGKVFGAMHAITDVTMLFAPALFLGIYEANVSACFVTLGALGGTVMVVFVVGTRPSLPSHDVACQ